MAGQQEAVADAETPLADVGKGPTAGGRSGLRENRVTLNQTQGFAKGEKGTDISNGCESGQLRKGRRLRLPGARTGSLSRGRGILVNPNAVRVGRQPRESPLAARCHKSPLLPFAKGRRRGDLWRRCRATSVFRSAGGRIPGSAVVVPWSCPLSPICGRAESRHAYRAAGWPGARPPPASPRG
jgi:hypothetical protein